MNSTSLPTCLSAWRRHACAGVWVALLALLAAALLPTLDRLTARGGDGYTEVCTPQGMKIVALADGEQRPAAGLLHADHCPFCGSAGDSPGAPPPAAPALQRPVGSGEAAPPQLQPLRAQRSWTIAHPRAPPLRT